MALGRGAAFGFGPGGVGAGATLGFGAALRSPTRSPSAALFPEGGATSMITLSSSSASADLVSIATAAAKLPPFFPMGARLKAVREGYTRVHASKRLYNIKNSGTIREVSVKIDPDLQNCINVNFTFFTKNHGQERFFHGQMHAFSRYSG